MAKVIRVQLRSYENEYYLKRTAEVTEGLLRSHEDSLGHMRLAAVMRLCYMKLHEVTWGRKINEGWRGGVRMSGRVFVV